MRGYAVAFEPDSTGHADRLFGAASITMPPIRRWRHIGGYLSGHARHRLLSVAAFSSAFVLGWQSSRLPTDYVSMAKVSCRARGHDPVRVQKRAITPSAGDA
jgi:hypothetical protein